MVQTPSIPNLPKLLTFEEYLAYDDGTDNRYELVDGRLELMNPPTVQHLLIAKLLEQIFDAEIKRLGLRLVALREAGLRTGFRKSRLGDVLVLELDAVMAKFEASAVFEVPPILAVEVVSPDSVQRDYRAKRSDYGALGIPEYWIVDPLKGLVSVLRLNEGFYDVQEFRGGDRIISPTFPELCLTVEQIWPV